MSSYYPVADPLAARATVDLLLTCDVLTQQLNRSFAGFGISRSTFNVLMLLRHGPPEGMQLHEIGELLLVSRANITGLVDHLESKGYVTREVPESDRRVRHARLTSKAESLLDECAPAHFDWASNLLRDLTDQDKASLLHRLKQMRNSIKCNKDREPPVPGNPVGKQLSNEEELLLKAEG